MDTEKDNLGAAAEISLPAIQIMIVDDEESILNSLQRLLFDMDCDIRTSTCAHKALEMLTEQAADIVISDMRMPGMDGAEFLSEVAQKWPDSERILLTGYSDLESTIGAINKGKINFYMEKPWDDDRLRRIISKGIEITHNRYRTGILERTVLEQNEQLKALNDDLEAKVQARSKALIESNEKLQISVKKVRQNYQQTTQLFSSLIEQRMGPSLMSKQSLMLLLKKMAEKSDLDDIETKSLIYAGIFRNLGKIGFPDALIKTPYLELSVQQQREFQTHISVAESMMSSMPPLRGAAKILSQREEHLDGSGYPQGINASEITTASKILCAVSDMMLYCQGLIVPNELAINESLEKLKELSGQYYDPVVVEHLCSLESELGVLLRQAADKFLSLEEVEVGMVLHRDLIAANGSILLAEGYELDREMISRLRKLERQLRETFKVYVKEDSA
ncbi:HD domain-containing phosphohydrolase [Pseudoteredinibacter isoporae]|uniref:Response regulator RpfG family c-di-GMP phosphodiesterase n=1 Tax=Pseudoteredinibacter isoporae TaxID=570281 RepID=A0A7X0JX03_9GAMM|nr:HD domain-containing phosphohydrolase [Pseudoteredinibacter isoporae]MBB6523060.1 response regulator RpfG family c-di-GMP phosphodiesterase [Pseudoteredinibacter isoporae]NHO88580.1 response regulator [Pseudoteredinibacter isoporae]NIB22729.1 response regulator [Pseudoteredinibacter isoporae]